MLPVKSNLRSICFKLGHFFCSKQKNIFGTFGLLFILLLFFISTLLTSPTIPSLLSQHPSPYCFCMNAYLVSLEPQTYGFPLDFMSWYLTGETWMQVPQFLYYIYIAVVINFLKLFKLLHCSTCTSALTIYKLILL